MAQYIPPKVGVSNTYSPGEIFTAKPVGYKNIARWYLVVMAKQ